jgi:hypothetical protein
LSDEKTTGWPAEADNVDRRSESDDAGSGDGSLWDKATINEIDAKQRKAPLWARFHAAIVHEQANPQHPRSRPTGLGSYGQRAKGRLSTARSTQYPTRVTLHNDELQ